MTTKNRDSNLDEQKDDYLFDDACRKIRWNDGNDNMEIARRNGGRRYKNYASIKDQVFFNDTISAALLRRLHKRNPGISFLSFLFPMVFLLFEGKIRSRNSNFFTLLRITFYYSNFCEGYISIVNVCRETAIDR